MLPRILFCLAIMILGLSTASALTEVEVAYSHRLISHGPDPDPDIVAAGIEGGFEARFTGMNPIDLISPAEGFTRLDASTFSYVFTWDDLAPLTVSFIDDLGDTTTVTATPEAPHLLDPASHTIPVLNIQTEPAGLWDPDTGIYVWGNHENMFQHGSAWERPAVMEYYEGSNEPVFTKEIGLRIHGGWSRCYDQKGMRFYFDHGTDSPSIDHDFFGSDPTDFMRLLIKTHRYPDLAIKADMAEALFHDLGHLASRTRHVVVALNREYWGTYSLRERLDEEFVEFTHDLAGQDYVMIKDCEGVHGDPGPWFGFLDSINDLDSYDSHAWYTDIEENLDLASYIDWMLINIFGATSDNMNCGNLVILRVGDEPWRYVMWDEDGLFAESNQTNDHFRFFSSITEADYEQYRPPTQNSGSWFTSQPYFKLFNSLMQNSEFKARFFIRANELLNGEMSVASLHDRFDAISANYQPEKTMQSDRWNWWSPGLYDYILNTTKSWVTTRHPLVSTQLTDFMEDFRVPVELSQFDADVLDQQVQLTWQTESEEDNAGFLVYRRLGAAGPMSLLASYDTATELVGQGTVTTPTSYTFVDATTDQATFLEYQLKHVSTFGDTTTVDWIEPVSMHPFEGLVINELMADNETALVDRYGEADDWFEIHNPSAEDINLDGLYITDDLANPVKHQLSGGLIISAGQKFIFWADEQPEQGPAHLSFKLARGGETLALVAPDGITVLDQVEYEQQFTDHVLMRHPDVTGPWTYGWDPTPAMVNTAPRLTRFIMLNEIMSRNTATMPDEMGEYEPWLEVWNRLPIPVSLDGLDLSTYGSGVATWPLPSETLEPMAHQIIWLDNEPGEGPFHAALTPHVEGGVLCLQIQDEPFIDFVSYPALADDEVYARIPDGEAWQSTMLATPGMANPASLAPVLVINEFLASNDDNIQDEAGEYEDWVEIFNPGDEPVDLEGMHLSDDLAESTQWTFPAVTLGAGEFLIVWCDDDPLDGPLHATFKLSSGGEAIGLWYSTEDGNGLIDSIVYESQTTDVSMGRTVDAGPAWTTFAEPSPGYSNHDPVAVPPAVSALVMSKPYPNPFNPAVNLAFTLPFDGHVSLEVFDVRGRRVCRLVSQVMAAGPHAVVWRGTDEQGQNVSSGVYLARLVQHGATRSQRLMLVR